MWLSRKWQHLSTTPFHSRFQQWSVCTHLHYRIKTRSILVKHWFPSLRFMIHIVGLLLKPSGSNRGPTLRLFFWSIQILDLTQCTECQVKSIYQPKCIRKDCFLYSYVFINYIVYVYVCAELFILALYTEFIVYAWDNILHNECATHGIFVSPLSWDKCWLKYIRSDLTLMQSQRGMKKSSLKTQKVRRGRWRRRLVI